MAFNGNNLCTDSEVVTFGPAGNPTTYTCAVNTALSTSALVVCSTQAYASGTGLVFRVSAGGQFVTGSDQLNYPGTFPVVNSARGCPINIGNVRFFCFLVVFSVFVLSSALPLCAGDVRLSHSWRLVDNDFRHKFRQRARCFCRLFPLPSRHCCFKFTTQMPFATRHWSRRACPSHCVLSILYSASPCFIRCTKHHVVECCWLFCNWKSSGHCHLPAQPIHAAHHSRQQLR